MIKYSKLRNCQSWEINQVGKVVKVGIYIQSLEIIKVDKDVKVLKFLGY